VTPEEIIQKIIEKVDEGDPEVLARISLVMKNRILTKKKDLKEIEALLEAQVKKKYN
jgi:S-adenosylmethionine:tRNA-ribosyltransferase-isomerase (queuine synthetase)